MTVPDLNRAMAYLSSIFRLALTEFEAHYGGMEVLLGYGTSKAQ